MTIQNMQPGREMDELIVRNYLKGSYIKDKWYRDQYGKMQYLKHWSESDGQALELLKALLADNSGIDFTLRNIWSGGFEITITEDGPIVAQCTGGTIAECVCRAILIWSGVK